MNAKNSFARQKGRFIETARSRIDLCLQNRLDETRTVFAATSSRAIVDEVARVTTAGGGRIRPLLCCSGYDACGGEGGPLDERIVRVAAGLELLHTFAILHDDVMDGSPVRRGQPSTFARAAEERRASGMMGDADRYGVSVAILAGDLALIMSDQLIAESGFAPERLAEVSVPLNRMRLDAIAGQYLDLAHSGKAISDPNLTARIARLKTGSYSVEGPILVGATLAGGSPAAKKALSAFAQPLGEAFQLTDDLLGMFGDPRQTGKSAANDLRQGKPTSLMARAVSLAAPVERESILSIWGDPDSSDEDLEILRKLVRESGAVRSMLRSLDRLVKDSKAALVDPAASGLRPEPCAQMTRLADGIVARAKKLQQSA